MKGKKLLSSRSKGSKTSSAITSPGDQKQREIKSTPYQSSQYGNLLETKCSFMHESKLGITDASKTICQTLLETEQVAPRDSLFQDDQIDDTCDMIQDRNDAKVIQDIARLIVPSAQSLAIRNERFKILIESVNEGWKKSMPITRPRPQPDYSVGFKGTAFTEDQLQRLHPLIGSFSERSYIMATYYMYFPFLTCEVKCSSMGLDIADRQNAHSMTIAVRAVVELFRLVKREKELHREILAFSVSHDNEIVKIYGHYPIIDGPKTTFYRHPIRGVFFGEFGGNDRWTAYKFTKSIYDVWMPMHFERICSAIDKLPLDSDFGRSEPLTAINSDTMSLTGNGDI
jgi:hypothetical protein